MKRYIIFVGTMGNGGAQRVISILSKKMVEQDMDVEIVTYYDENLFYDIDSRVRYTVAEQCTGTKNVGKNVLWLRQYFQEHAKIVISFLAPFNMIALVAMLGSSTPVIVADRNDPQRVPSNKILRALRDFLYMFADGIVLQTNKNKEYFNSIVRKKSEVIYNPVSMGEYAGISLRTKKDIEIVSVGRLMPQKNQKMLIEAFGEVVKQYPEHKLYIYGEGPSGEELEKLVKKLDLAGKVFLPGSVKDLYERIKNAQMFVLSSDYEGMPNALIEAMCLGLPVISTRVSGATDLILDHENGILVEVGNQEKLQDAMLQLIENPELAAHLANKAVELNETLELSKIMNQWIDFIKKITAEKY